jgi:hypothetical protein
LSDQETNFTASIALGSQAGRQYPFASPIATTTFGCHSMDTAGTKTPHVAYLSHLKLFQERVRSAAL